VTDKSEKVILEDVVGQSIEHEGVLRLSGDVRDGAVITGKAGVHILGSVFGAQIFSDGDITIQGDIRGEGGTVVKAGKTLTAKNIENAAIVADTVVCDSIRKSRIHAYNVIEAVTGIGEVHSTQCRAGNRFSANVLGQAGGHETVVEVELADKNRVLRNLFTTEESIRVSTEELDRLQRVVQMVKLMGEKVRELDQAKQQELRAKLQRVVELQGILKSLEEQHLALSGELEAQTVSDNSYPVEVRGKAIRGVIIKIDGAMFELTESFSTGAGFYKRKRILVKVF